MSTKLHKYYEDGDPSRRYIEALPPGEIDDHHCPFCGCSNLDYQDSPELTPGMEINGACQQYLCLDCDKTFTAWYDIKFAGFAHDGIDINVRER